MVNIVGFLKEVVSWINFVVLFIFVVFQLIVGLLFDKIGCCLLLMVFGIFGILLIVLIFFFMEKMIELIVVFLFMMVGFIIVIGYILINVIVKVEFFLIEICVFGVGLLYVLIVVIFGGIVEFIVLWLKSIGMELFFYFYVVGCIVISFIMYWCMDELLKILQIEVEFGGGDKLVNNKFS